MEHLFIILVGVAAGTASGFFGVGGAIILVPVLVYIFKFSQHLAQGTALTALLGPVAIFAVIKYYQAGNVNIRVAIFLALGFLIGGFVGATFAQGLPNIVLKKLFGALLFCISLYMLLGK